MRAVVVRCGLVALVIALFVWTQIVSAESGPGSGVRASRGCGVAAPVAAGETGAFSMTVGDLAREYRLHLPAGYDPDTPVSLVIDIHG